MAVKTVAVLGAGAMGGGIAQVAAQSGYNVILNDVDIKFVNKAMERIDAFMQKGIEKGKFTPEQKEQVLGRINGTTDMNQFADADLVIEAIIEDLNVKRMLLRN